MHGALVGLGALGTGVFLCWFCIEAILQNVNSKLSGYDSVYSYVMHYPGLIALMGVILGVALVLVGVVKFWISLRSGE